MAAPTEQKRKPGWMTIPGGPKEPNFQDFRSKFQALVDQKKKCFDDLKAIRSEFDAARGDTGDKTAVDKERTMLREKINKIDAERKKERDSRRAADDRIKAIRADRQKIQKQLDALYDEVGAFTDVAEIDEAIDLVMYKLETGAASLSAEKACIKRLSKLEDAKSLLQKLEPLEEAVSDAQERELQIQQESREIHARIAVLNGEYEQNLSSKIEKDKERQKTTVDFSALHKKRDTISKSIDDLNTQIDTMRADFDKAQEAWREWRVVAQEKFNAKMNAEREERDRVWKEREAERKRERRMSRAAKKLNPHKLEIDACGTLVQYLEQKVKIHAREVEEAEKRKKLAAFDAAAAAPKGAVVGGAGEDEWLFADRSSTKGKGKQPAKAKAPAEKKPAPAGEQSKDSKKKQMHHSNDKMSLFKLVNVEAPTTYGAVDETVTKLKALKKEFEAKIIVNPDDVDITSSDDEAANAAAADDDATQVASTAAPTAA